MGAFGKWHILVCSTIFLLKFPVAWHQVRNKTKQKIAQQQEEHCGRHNKFIISDEYHLSCTAIEFLMFKQYDRQM